MIFSYRIADMLPRLRTVQDPRRMLLGALCYGLLALIVPLSAQFEAFARAELALSPLELVVKALVGACALVVFLVLAIALQRHSAVDIARHQQVGLVDSLHFGARSLRALIGAGVFIGVASLPALLCIGLALWLHPLGHKAIAIGLVVIGIPFGAVALLLMLTVPLLAPSLAVMGGTGSDGVLRCATWIARRFGTYLALWIAKGVLVGAVLAAAVAIPLGLALLLHGSWQPALVNNVLPGWSDGVLELGWWQQVLVSVVSALSVGCALAYSAELDVVIFLLLRHRAEATPVQAIWMPREVLAIRATRQERDMALEVLGLAATAAKGEEEESTNCTNATN